jgi:hypothetical protein
MNSIILKDIANPSTWPMIELPASGSGAGSVNNVRMMFCKRFFEMSYFR